MLPHLPPVRLLAILLSLHAFALSQVWAQRAPSPLNKMDHGPFVSSTISTDPLSIRSIFVYKGIAVRVGEDEEAVMVFDTDLLRVAARACLQILVERRERPAGAAVGDGRL